MSKKNCVGSFGRKSFFSDPKVAAALESGLERAGYVSHLVGEGYADRSGWLAQDDRWVDQAARSRVILSAPGMAALSVALVYRKPISTGISLLAESYMTIGRKPA